MFCAKRMSQRGVTVNTVNTTRCWALAAELMYHDAGVGRLDLREQTQCLHAV